MVSPLITGSTICDNYPNSVSHHAAASVKFKLAGSRYCNAVGYYVIFTPPLRFRSHLIRLPRHRQLSLKPVGRWKLLRPHLPARLRRTPTTGLFSKETSGQEPLSREPTIGPSGRDLNPAENRITIFDWLRPYATFGFPGRRATRLLYRPGPHWFVCKTPAVGKSGGGGIGHRSVIINFS